MNVTVFVQFSKMGKIMLQHDKLSLHTFDMTRLGDQLSSPTHGLNTTGTLYKSPVDPKILYAREPEFERIGSVPKIREIFTITTLAL